MGSGPKNLKRYDITDGKIFFYFDEVSSDCYSCVNFLIYEEYNVKKLKPKSITVYDYYEPSYRAFRYYVYKG